MTVQDLNVLVNLAERARQAGLIKFEEFAVVAESVKNAVEQINALTKSTPTENTGNSEPVMEVVKKAKSK